MFFRNVVLTLTDAYFYETRASGHITSFCVKATLNGVNVCKN